MEQITSEKLKTILSYNPLDGSFVWKLPSKYHNELQGKEAGTINSAHRRDYISIQICGRKYKRSRLAYLYMTGKYPPQQIDHINGDTTDDRWSNLRAVNHQQNVWNIGGTKKKTGLPLGVKRTHSGKYLARITKFKKVDTFGPYDNPNDAADVYLEKRREYFGEYNRL